MERQQQEQGQARRLAEPGQHHRNAEQDRVAERGAEADDGVALERPLEPRARDQKAEAERQRRAAVEGAEIAPGDVVGQGRGRHAAEQQHRDREVEHEARERRGRRLAEHPGEGGQIAEGQQAEDRQDHVEDDGQRCFPALGRNPGRALPGTSTAAARPEFERTPPAPTRSNPGTTRRPQPSGVRGVQFRALQRSDCRRPCRAIAAGDGARHEERHVPWTTTAASERRFIQIADQMTLRRSRIYGDFRINPRTSVAIANATSFSNFSLNAQHGGYYELSASAGQRRGGECGDLRSGSRRHRYQRG